MFLLCSLSPFSPFSLWSSKARTVIELRYIRYITFSILKRKKPSTQYGNLVERRTAENVKDTLIRDIHSILMFGEGSTSSVPKSLFETDRPVTSFGTQTGLCMEPPTACIFDLDVLKSQLLEKIDELRNEVLCTSELECISPPVVGEPPRVVNLPSVDVTSAEDRNAVNSAHGPTNPREILIAGDSLLHRLKQHKMKVGEIETLKLTQRGDNLDETFSRTHNFISRRADTNFDIVILAGTNDLSKPSVSPRSLIGKLKENVNDIKNFSNVSKIFLFKVPPRSDKHRVNSKIKHFNNLLVDKLSNTDNIIIVETIPLEARLFHTDNLHLNDKGLRQISGIIQILSVLYKVIAPNLYRPKRNYMSPRLNRA